MPADRSYATMADLERDFEARLSVVSDSTERIELLRAKADAQGDFKRQEKEKELQDAWKRLVLQEFPNAAKFPELVRGTTEEELRESARDVEERVSSLAAKTATPDAFTHFREQAASLYGPAGAGGTGPGSGPPATGMSQARQNERRMNELARKWNESPRDSYGAKMNISPAEVDEYTRLRAVEHIGSTIGWWGEMTRSDFAARRRLRPGG